jgi:putative hydrolase of the HAD superfamily
VNAVYLTHRFEDTELFDDVLPALDALRGRYELGLISNGNTYPERTGLGGRFRFVVFSQDHGIEKPDPRLFEIAIEEAGCAGRELLHVGDSLRDDVGGAKGVGVRSVWLNRNHAGNDTDIQPDFEVSSLTDLPRICDTLT